MMAIGIGARSGVVADDITAAILRVEEQSGRRASVIATLEDARFLDSVRDAAHRSGTLFKGLSLSDLQSRSSECQTSSERAISLYDVTSIAEAAALAAAGPDSKLIVPRLISGFVTAAAAISSDHVEVHS